MDIDQLPQSLLLARGRFSTVRAMHEDELKRLQMLCGQLSAVPSQVLRLLQQSDESNVADVSAILQDGRMLIDQLQECAKRVSQLAAQKAELRPTAWPK